jgi:O-acetylserine/cysteine efflux transporter
MILIDMIYAFIIPLAWGVNVVSMKASVTEFPALLSNLLRFVLAGMILLPFLKKIKIEKHLFYTAFYYSTGISLATLSVKGDASASLAILIFQLNVPITAILSSLLLKDSLNAKRILGIVISFVGISVIFLKPHIQYNYTSIFLILLSACFWAMFNINLKQVNEKNKLSLLGWVLLLSIPYLFVTCICFDHFDTRIIARASTFAWTGIIISALFSTIIGFGLWSYLVQKYPLSMVAPFNLLAPIFGALFSYLVFDEQLNYVFWIGTSITLAGVITVVLGADNAKSHNK